MTQDSSELIIDKNDTIAIELLNKEKSFMYLEHVLEQAAGRGISNHENNFRK